MKTVDILALDRNAETEHVGSFTYDGAQLTHTPHSYEMSGIAAGFLVVPEFLGGGSVSATEDPAKWLECLQWTYRSPYLRATAPKENG